jgi:hypothetical protein
MRQSLHRHVSLATLYFNAVETYTTRKLSYASDMLNAFTGVLNIQCQQLNSEHYYGLPTVLFDIALLWQPARHLKRQAGFPSWSWAGWDGPVRWLGDTMELSSYGTEPGAHLEFEKITRWLRERTWINWQRYGDGYEPSRTILWKPQVELPNSRLEQDQDTDDIINRSGIGYDQALVTAQNPYGRSNASTDMRHNYVRPHKKGESSNEDTFSVSPIPAYLLSFRTLVASYRIRPSTAYLRYGSIDPAWVPAGRIIFHIINKNTAISGYVMLDSSWDEKFQQDPNREYEFLILSEANYYCNWGRPHEGHPYARGWDMVDYREWHVMMTDTVNGGLRERVGLGRVLKDSLVDSGQQGPTWMDVVLG